MEALKRKWNSSRGASILLALLFLLVCMMVGASVLAAAASNAGKIQSNKKEQQKYLTLSSAMSLLIDELESVEYVGKYTYEEPVCIHFVPDENGSYTYNEEDDSYSEAEGGAGGYSQKHDHDYQYDQEHGELRHRDDGPIPKDDWTGTGGLANVLPLNDDLDNVFANHFVVHGKEEDDQYIFKELENTSYKGSYTLEFAANASDDYGGLTDDKVRIEFTLRTDGSIVLRATLLENKGKDEDGNTIWDGSAGYTMEALLRPVPDDWPEKRLVLKENPAPDADDFCRTDPIRWKLEYIFKKEAVPSAEPEIP